jgi:hypothetical protein
MKKLLCILFFVLILGIVGYCLSESKTAFINRKSQKIENEIAQLKDHLWAGRYYHGDGLGVNVSLILAPENGFTVTWHGCLGLYDQNHGTVDWDGKRIKLSFAYDLQEGYIGHYASEYKPIRWGERVYLIPTDEMIEFCNAVNDGREPRNGSWGWFFLRENDTDKEATGKPMLPEEFMPYLLDEPIDTIIVSIKDIREGDKITTVVIDKGTRDGLLPGMILDIIKPERVFGKMKLTVVEETQSEGEVVVYPIGTGQEKTTPAEGWEFSTRRWGR